MANNEVTNDSVQVWGDGSDSTIGDQLNTFYHIKKSLIDLTKEQYFGQMGDSTKLPKNHGKEIKRLHYMPLLDDRNVNDQGIDASGAVIANGNLYGSSKDVGTITAKLPVLGEHGGRVNRVGFKRITIQGSIENLGFFEEYSKESVDFDTDSQLRGHITRETMRGANEITEDALQVKLLNAAGVVRYGGAATSIATVSGETGDESLLTYELLMRLGITLDNNRCPKATTMVSGSRFTDTKTIDAARYAYIGSELLPTLYRMVDLHGNQAFVAARQYAAGGSVARGEAGAIGDFRFIVVPEMQARYGAGADVTVANAGYRETGDKYDVYPMLTVGSGSFTNLRFGSKGGKVGFTIYHKTPEQNGGSHDPFHKSGYYSIQWWYGVAIWRPEWISVTNVVAEL